MRDQHGQYKKGHQGSRATQFKPGEHWRDPKPYWNRDWLYEEYIVKQRSAAEIAKDFNCHRNNIQYFLHKHSIEARTTSESRAVKHWGSSGEKNNMFGVSGADHPNWKGGTTPERQSFYHSIEWGSAIKVVWARDCATCQRCGKISAGKLGSFHIHHIISFSEAKELQADPENLTLLCRDCHHWVHSKANADNEFLKEVVPNGVASERECSANSAP